MKRFSNYLLALLMATLATASPALAQKVTVIGSDTMAQLNQKWAQEFMKAYPNIKVEVSGGGSGVGIAALRNGTTDVAAASRLIKSKETQDFLVGLNVKPVQHEVALDGVVIFVNEKNPVETLSLTQIEKIYRGEITNWKELGGIDLPIVLYGREANSGTYGFVKEVVLKEKDFSSKVQTLAGTAAVYDAVGKDTSGIGYGGIGYAHGVRELKVKLDDKPETIGIAPTLDNVAKGVYPLSRPLLYYTTPNNTNTNTDIYVSWVRSTQGQKLVEVVGFVPLPAAKLVAAPTPAAPAASESRFTTSVPKAPAHPQLPSGGTTAIVSVPTAPSRTNSPSAATTGTPSTTPVSAPQPASAPAAVPTPAPVQPTATAATPTEAATEAKTTDLPISTIIPSGPLTSEQLSQIRSALVEREKQVARREMDVAEREDSVAQREISVGKRENAFVPKRYNRR